MAAPSAVVWRMGPRFSLFRRSFATTSVNHHKSKIGQSLPDINLYEATPQNVVNIRELFQDRKGIIFSVLGAYTPGCSQAHFPEYLNNYDKFQEAGYTEIVCVSVNDPFVMGAWSNEVNTEGKIRMLADSKCEFTKALNMEQDYTPFLGNERSQRYSLVVEDGIITHLNWEPDNTGLACLLCVQKTLKDREAEANPQKKKNTIFKSKDG